MNWYRVTFTMPIAKYEKVIELQAHNAQDALPCAMSKAGSKLLELITEHQQHPVAEIDCIEPPGFVAAASKALEQMIRKQQP